MMNATLERVTDSTSHLFAPCIDILARSIPVREQLSGERLTSLLLRDSYRLYAFRSDNETVGAALLYLPSDRSFAWLDYMAIRADRQGRGLGSRLFRDVVDLASKERATAAWLFLEVDDDREGSDEVCRMNKRRIEFYRRLRGRLLANVPYRFPSPNGAPVPMRLLAYQLHPSGALSRQCIAAAIEDIFFHIHGRDRDDPLLQWILDRLPSVLALE